MKKILVVALTVIAFATSAFGLDSNNYDVFYKSSNTQKFTGLIRYIQTDYDQTSQLKMIFSMTEKKLKSAIEANDQEAVDNALNFNVLNAKIILSEEQYKKYLAFVNLSINNQLENYIAKL